MVQKQGMMNDDVRKKENEPIGEQKRMKLSITHLGGTRLSGGTEDIAFVKSSSG